MSILPSAFSVASRVFSTAARSDTSTLNAVTRGADFLGGPLRERLVVIPDRDLGAGGDEALGDRAAETLRAAGDDGAAAVQIDLVHGEILLVSNRMVRMLALRVSNHERGDGFRVLRGWRIAPLRNEVLQL